MVRTMRSSPVRWVALVTLMVLGLETFSLLVLYVLKTYHQIDYAPISLTTVPKEQRAELENLLAGRTQYFTYSATLGWTIKPNGTSPQYRANSRGLRANREYSPTPPRDVVRISAFGDSFTHASDVANDATWQEALMRLNRNLEVLNYGVPGFGLDQAFLRYRHEGAMDHAHIVLIGILSESIFRSVNVYRPFYAPGSLPLAKPRFVLDGDKLILLENPMRELSQYRELLTNPEPVLRRLAALDYYFPTRYQEGVFDVLRSVRLLKITQSILADRQRGIFRGGSYDTTSEAFRVTMGTLDLFVTTLSRNGSIPIVVVFPHRGDLAQYKRNHTTRNAVIIEHLRKKGYRYIDLLEGFEKYGSNRSMNDLIVRHYTPLGYEIAARTIQNYLVANRLADLASLSRP